MATPRRSTKAGRQADTVFGYLIPGFLVVLAAYQQVTQGAVDKYVLGLLAVFGLGALGWRLDVLFEGYMRMRYGAAQEPAPQETNTNDDSGAASDAK